MDTRSHIRGVALAAALLTLPAAASPQASALAGIVRTSDDGSPLAGVLIRVDTGERTMTDAGGAFHLPAVAPGRHEVALVAPGCQITFRTVRLEAGVTSTEDFAIAFDEALVADLTRKTRAGGTLVSAADIEAMHARTLLDVVARVAPGMVVSPATQPGGDPRIAGRGYVTAQGPRTPAVIVDGVALGPDGCNQLNDIQASDVAWLEIQRGASGGWELGTGGAGGVIRVTTRRGGVGGFPSLDPRLCTVPGWPR